MVSFVVERKSRTEPSPRATDGSLLGCMAKECTLSLPTALAEATHRSRNPCGDSIKDHMEHVDSGANRQSDADGKFDGMPTLGSQGRSTSLSREISWSDDVKTAPEFVDAEMPTPRQKGVSGRALSFGSSAASTSIPRRGSWADEIDSDHGNEDRCSRDDEAWKRGRTPSPDCVWRGWSHETASAHRSFEPQVMVYTPVCVPPCMMWAVDAGGFPIADSPGYGSQPDYLFNDVDGRFSAGGHMVHPAMAPAGRTARKNKKNNKAGRTLASKRAAKNKVAQDDLEELPRGRTKSEQSDFSWDQDHAKSLQDSYSGDTAHTEGTEDAPSISSDADTLLAITKTVRDSELHRANATVDTVGPEKLSSSSEVSEEAAFLCVECGDAPKEKRDQQAMASSSKAGSSDEVRMEDEEAAKVSKGSVGHPHNCAPACKYHQKVKGCKDGDNCAHCHVCVWKPERSVRRNKKKRPAASAEAAAPPNAAAADIDTSSTCVAESSPAPCSQ